MDNFRPEFIHTWQVTPDVSIAKVVQYFKDGTSRVIRQENPELEEFLWDDSYLADGYFAETVVRAQEETAKHYVREKTSSMPKES